MTRQLTLTQAQHFLKASALINAQGLIRSHDEAWLQCVVFLGLPRRQSYMALRYADLFRHWPDCYTAIKNLIDSIGRGECQQGSIAAPQANMSIHMSRMLGGSEEILVQHIEQPTAEDTHVSAGAGDLDHPLSVGTIVYDAAGDCVHTDAEVSAMFGECLAFILGQGDLPPNYRCYSHGDALLSESPIRPLIGSPRDTEACFSLGRPSGERAWFHVQVKVRAAGSQGAGRVYFYINDTSASKAEAACLIAAHTRLQLAAEVANIGIWEWNTQRGEVTWNEKMYQLCGLIPGELQPEKAWVERVHPDDRERVMYHIKRCVRLKEDVRVDFRVNFPDGVRHLRCQVRVLEHNKSGEVKLIGASWDITSKVFVEQRLHAITYCDPVTGLPNRAKLMFQLNRTLARAMRGQRRAALLTMDVDSFKDINDNLGHPVGDEFLYLLAERVKALLRREDSLARIASDEFAIVLDGVQGPEDAEALTDRIREALTEPFYTRRGAAIQASLSIGVGVFPDDGADATTLLRAADLAMYNAKRCGGNMAKMYSPRMSAELNRKLTMELMLREASRDESFELYYQPIVNLTDSGVMGCEALIRWRDNNGNFVSPRDFIPVAENCGLITKIGNWVMETAFKQWLLWKNLDHDLSYISVNVSPHQLHESEFSEYLIGLAYQYGVNPRQVQLEITEGTFLLEAKNADSQLQHLIDAGFRLAIDDFGTGYSSLAYLKRFNVDVIKVDRGFIVDIESNKADREIVNAILSMTESLGFQVLVEGVEEFGQKNLVRHMGCQFAQGFLFGRPTFSDEFAEKYLLEERSCNSKDEDPQA